MAPRRPSRAQTHAQRRITLLVVGALALILVVAWVSRAPAPGTLRRRMAGAMAGPTASSLGAEIDWQVPGIYEARWPDPTRLSYVGRRPVVTTPQPSAPAQDPNVTAPVVKPLPPPPRLDIRGVVFSEQEPLAIVGTEVLHEGDLVGPVKIVKIHLDGVDLLSGDRTWKQGLSE